MNGCLPNDTSNTLTLDHAIGSLIVQIFVGTIISWYVSLVLTCQHPDFRSTARCVVCAAHEFALASYC